MKKIFAKSKVLLIAILINSAAVFAQGPDGPRAEHKERMIKELNLTTEQQTEMKAVHKSFRKEVKALRDANDGDRKAMRSQVEALEVERNKEIAQILDAEQYAKFEKLEAEMKEKRKAHRDERRGQGMHGPMGRKGKAGMKGKNKELRKEVRSYVQANVLPVMKEQRLKLDEKMSNADRNKVDELRAQLKELRPQMKAAHKSMRQSHKQGGEVSASQKAEMEQIHTQRKEIMEGAREIAKKYESELIALREEVKPQSEEWKSELKAIAQKHVGENEEECKGMHHMGRKLRKHVRPAHFILMDPNAEALPFPGEEEEGFGAIQRAPQKDRVVKLYPNPSLGAQTLEYEVLQAGEVRVDLVSKDGDVVKNVYKGYQEAGVHSLQVDNQNLRSNVYYYSINDQSGKTLKQFVISK